MVSPHRRETAQLEDLPAELRWREWMMRVEAVIFASAEPVTRVAHVATIIQAIHRPALVYGRRTLGAKSGIPVALFELPATPTKAARVPRCIFHGKLQRQSGIFHLKRLDVPRDGSAHLDLPEAREPVNCYVVFFGAVEKCLDERIACKSLPLIISTNAFIVEIVNCGVIAHKQSMGDITRRRGCIVDPCTLRALVNRVVLRFDVNAWPFPDRPTKHYAATFKFDFPRDVRKALLRQRLRIRYYL